MVYIWYNETKNAEEKTVFCFSVSQTICETAVPWRKTEKPNLFKTKTVEFLQHSDMHQTDLYYLLK
jgi:hypothetical protein